MARRDRSRSPDTPNKRVRASHRSSPRSPSPTRRTQRPPRSRYDDDRDRDRDHRDRDRYRDDRYRDDRRRDYDRRGDPRDDRRDDRRRSRSRDRKDRERAPPTPPRAPPEKEAAPTASPVEDEKLKAKRAKLEAWKKEREAKKALDEAKAKAMALAGKSVPRELYSDMLIFSDFTSLDPMPFQLQSTEQQSPLDNSTALLWVGSGSRGSLSNPTYSRQTSLPPPQPWMIRWKRSESLRRWICQKLI